MADPRINIRFTTNAEGFIMTNTSDVFDVEQQQRAKALGVARDLLGPTAGIFGGTPEATVHPDRITDLIELSEYVLTGNELVHYTDEDTGVMAVDVVDLSLDRRVAASIEQGVRDGIARRDADRLFGWLRFEGRS